MVIITINGNIGSGKTSVLNYLHRYYKLSIDLEPIDKWTPYLNEFYKNKKSAFKFQIRVWLDRSWIQEKTDKSLIIMERSPFFNRHIFVNSVYNENLITENEYAILNDLYDKTDSVWSCNTYIYLRSNPENCIERIKKRGRDCEQNVDLEYITKIHDLHESTYRKALDNNLNIICIDVEDKTISQIATEIYNLSIIQNELTNYN
jgi:deoxyadenosine/deoxycytidine kinase